MSSLRTTIASPRSRRNVAVVIASATIAVLGLGGGAALALNGGDDHHGIDVPTVQPHTTAQAQQPEKPEQPQQPQQPEQPQEPASKVPDPEMVCSGEGLGQQVKDPLDSTTDAGRTFTAYFFTVDGQALSVFDLDRNDSIDGATIDTDGDDESDLVVSCTSATDHWRAM
jgi:hypothetical protein